MTDLNQIYIAIVLNKGKESNFAKQIKDGEIDFSTIKSQINFNTGTINELLEQLDIDFGDKSSLKELESNDAILYLQNQNGKIKILECRLNPETEYDWVKTSQDFIDNITNDKSDGNGYWKWGQVAQEDGEFLCIDCGLIIELKKGDVFPICEVCLSGDPSAPDSKSDEGFWELV